MNTNTESFSYNRTTPRANLRSVAGINAHYLRTSLFHFVREKGKQLTPRSIINALSKPASGKADNIQILNGNQGEFTDKPPRQFVIEVSTLIGDFLVCLGNLLGRSMRTGGPPLSPRKTPLLSPQFGGGLAQIPRGFDQFSGREGYDCGNAKVYSNHWASMLRDWVGLNVNGEYGIPPISLSQQRCSFHLAKWQFTVFEDTDVAHVLNTQSPVLGPTDAISKRIDNRMPSVASLEPGIAGRLTTLHAAKKRGKGFIQSPKGSLHRRKVEQHKGGVVRPNVLELGALAIIVGGHLAATPQITTFIKRIVVQLAMQFQNALKQFRLFLVRVKTILVVAQSVTSKSAQGRGQQVQQLLFSSGAYLPQGRQYLRLSQEKV